MLKRKNEQKKATEVSPSIPPATPFSNVAPAWGTAVLTSSAALSEPEEPTPRSWIQPWIWLTPLLRAAVISALFAMMPPTTSRVTSTRLISRPSSTTPAAAARGMCRCSEVTIGAVTAATIAAAITGPTIEEIWPRNQMRPNSRIPTPTRNHASIPKSRSQAGVANMWASCPAVSSGGGASPSSPEPPLLWRNFTGATPRGTAWRRGCYPAPTTGCAPRGVTRG